LRWGRGANGSDHKGLRWRYEGIDENKGKNRKIKKMKIEVEKLRKIKKKSVGYYEYFTLLSM
jgi:hypothetical protein